MQADERIYTWRGKDIETLTDAECRQALRFCVKNIIEEREERMRDHAFMRDMKTQSRFLNKLLGDGLNF